MGNQTLKPVTEKHIIIDENEQLEFVNCEMQGWRDTMVMIIYIFIAF